MREWRLALALLGAALFVTALTLGLPVIRTG